MNEQIKSMAEKIDEILPDLTKSADILKQAQEDHESMVAAQEEVKGLVEQLKALEASVSDVNAKLIDLGKKRIAVNDDPFGKAEKLDFAKFMSCVSKMSRKPSEKLEETIVGIFEKYSERSYAEAAKDVDESTDASGGYLIPEPFSDQIWRIAKQMSIALRDCMIVPLTVGNKLPILSLGSNVSVTWTGEGVNFTESNPTFGKSEITAKKLAAFSELTNELLEDEGVGVVNLIITLFGEVMGEEIDNQAFNGDGTVFTGILNASGINTVTMTAGQGFTDMDQDDLSSMIAQIQESVIANAKFYMHRTIFDVVRKLKDSQNNPIYWPPQGTNPATIYGYPVVLVEKMPSASATAANTPFVIFGNIKHYQIGTKGDMTVVVTGEGRTLTIADKKIVAVRRRMAMGIALGGAISVLQTGAAS